MRLKNTHLLLTALFLVVLHLVQVQSYSLIRSRIQGTFRDKETGEPLEGVEVTLFAKDGLGGFFENYGTKTDKNGRFTFDQVKYGKCFIKGEKSGYVTYHPWDVIIIPGMELVEMLNIKEGEIRYLDIKMERGGQLLAKIFKKDDTGISPYAHFSAQIDFRAGEDTLTLGGIRKEGEFIADGLPASDKYTLRLSAIERAGYPKFKTKFEIKKGEITTIEHTFDFTDDTGVTGVIYLDNEPVDIAVVTLEDINSHEIAMKVTRLKSEYIFRNIPPGLYTLRAYFRDENNKVYWESRKILIEKGILKNFDVRVKK